jgi:hypothetical protein
VRASRNCCIAFLDADDLWLPDKLSRTVAALEQIPECMLANSDAKKTDTSRCMLDLNKLGQISYKSLIER